MNSQIRVAVIGAGHMGRHHARIYCQLPDARLVAVADLDPARAREVAEPLGAQVVTRASELIGQVDAATIAVPTVYHEEVARPLIQAGIPVLVEKPLAPDTATARRMVDWADRHHTIIQVGHSERFNPVVLAMNRLQVQPRFVEADRISPFRFRSADIGVVFDLMIHDIDIVLHLVRCREYEVRAVGVAVLGPHEDIANARVEFANGAVATLTSSRLALKTERRIRVFAPEAYLSMDFQKKSGIAVKKDANLDLIGLARKHNYADLSQMKDVDFGSLVKVEPLQIDDVEPLRAEIHSFLQAVRAGRTPEVSAEDGLAAVELAEAVVARIKQSRWELQR